MVVAEVIEVVVGTAGFVTSHAPEAAVDRLTPEAGAGVLDFGDDVTAGELGGARPLPEMFDGVDDGASAARSGIGEFGL